MKNGNERATYFNNSRKRKTALRGLDISITTKNEKKQQEGYIFQEK